MTPQSVIIPVYNSSKWLADTLDSILKQSFNGKWEVSICDDSSTVKKEREGERELNFSLIIIGQFGRYYQTLQRKVH